MKSNLDIYGLLFVCIKRKTKEAMATPANGQNI